MSQRILVVDDEPDITALVAYHLARGGYRVSTAASGTEALRLARAERPDLVILDLMLPGVSGYDVLAELRRLTTPATWASSCSPPAARRWTASAASPLGADDYLTKPFSPAELSLRVGAVLRRLAAPSVAAGSTITAGPLTVDRSAHRAALDGQELPLTATEFKLLVTLLERRGRVQSRPHLLETVWEAQPDIQTRTVDMHVQRLRSKLGDHGGMIETVRGLGYRFRAADDNSR